MKVATALFYGAGAVWLAAAALAACKVDYQLAQYSIGDVLPSSIEISDAVRVTTLSSALHTFILTLFLGALGISIAAGSSAGNLSKDFPLQFRLAAFFRTPVLVFIVVPLSFIRRRQTEFEIAFDEMFQDPEGGHKARVESIAAQVKKWDDAGRHGVLRTARSNWASMSTKLASNKGEASKVAVGELNQILSIDLTNETITCEPGVTMGQLTHKLLPMGYSLVVQVEMESITIAGIAMGFGMETNSHTEGLFQETVVSYELVNSHGEVIHVTEESDPDAFRALPWSYGTLGFLTAITAKIHKIKPYVHVQYIPTASRQELCDKMTELSTSDNAPQFLEATIYDKETAVIQVGTFMDAPTTPEDLALVNDINSFWKPFYYKWVETFIEKGGGEEIIPIDDYYHRFTRSIFWELEDMIPFSNHPIYRCLWGWMGAPEVSLLKLFQGPVIRKASVSAHVVQESIMPVTDLAEGIERFDAWFGVYPLLVFPIRFYDRGNKSGFINPRGRNLVKGKNWGIWVDLGAYGAPRDVKEGKFWDAKTNIREMEHWTRDKGGWQACYTDVHATRQEFRQMFDHSLLDACRERWEATDAFPEVYDKIMPEKGIVDLSAELAAEAAAH